jgi:hypothetical protein
MTTSKRCQPPASNAEKHADKIADAVRTAWFAVHGSGRIDIPVCVVATLAAAPEKGPDNMDVTDMMLGWQSDEFMAYAKNIWTAVIRRRPDTAHLLYPLVSWLFDEPDVELQSHAHRAAQAALRAGQVDLTGGDRRREVDLLGTVLTMLRPPSALKGRGQFYTPASLTRLMALMSDVDGIQRVLDPAMGTGGMFRAVAEVMREKGRTPATAQWLGCDIDELAVACATVNSMIWNLGEDIVFCVADALVEDWEVKALAQRDELRRVAIDVQRYRALFALLDKKPEV